MGLFDKVTSMFSKKGGAAGGTAAPENMKEQAQHIAQQVDAQAEKLATKDGTVGDLAEKAHEVLDKVDGD